MADDLGSMTYEDFSAMERKAYEEYLGRRRIVLSLESRLTEAEGEQSRAVGEWRAVLKSWYVAHITPSHLDCGPEEIEG